MDASRNVDMVNLEKLLACIGREKAITTCATQPYRDSSSFSSITVQDARKSSSAFQVKMEAAVKLALHQERGPRDSLKVLEASPVFESLPNVKPLAWSRYAIFNVYRRLFSLVFLGNLVAFIWTMVKDRSLLTIIDAAAANMLALGLARQPLVVNLMFKIFGAVPRSAPLRLRCLCAKIYCYGGVHSGCGIASCLWYIGFVGLLTQNFVLERSTAQDLSRSFVISAALITMAYIVLVLLLAIVIAAYPWIRFMLHDYFELTHRYCGWAVVALFWPLLVLASHAQAYQNGKSLVYVLVRFPTFWMLIITTIAIIHPWVLIRRIKVGPESISTHAIRLHFHHTTVNFGQGIQLAKHPLRDWHSFATFPDIPSRPSTNGSLSKDEGFSCLISKAGDWTSDTIAKPPTHLWKRGIPIYGFGHAMKIFSRLIVVATGSGIGPCLSFLGHPDRPAIRVVWQTKTPLKTYGQPVMDLVCQLDGRPEILDTNRMGRVDMLPLVLRLVQEFDAEAICVISNPMVTRKLVFECESMSIPAFGPIFDS